MKTFRFSERRTLKVLTSFSQKLAVIVVAVGLLCAVNVKAQTPPINIIFTPTSGTTLTWEMVNEILNDEFISLSLNLPTSGTYSSIPRQSANAIMPEFTATIPDGITLGLNTFRVLTKLLGVTFSGNSGNVVSIGENAFLNCRNLTSITLPKGLTSIGIQAFDFCNLSVITIPANVTYINRWAFDENSNLTEITFLRVDPAGLTIETPLPFGANIEKIYIPNLAFKDAWATLLAGKGMGNKAEVEAKIFRIPRPPRKPGDVRIGGSVILKKGATLNIGKP